MSSAGVTKFQKVQEVKKEMARSLRKTSTPEERMLWEILRAGRLDGWKFRRQQVIDGFIADFYCEKAGLVVELDGHFHLGKTSLARDKERNEVMKMRGIKTRRFWNYEVKTNIEKVKKEILKCLLISD